MIKWNLQSEFGETLGLSPVRISFSGDDVGAAMTYRVEGDESFEHNEVRSLLASASATHGHLLGKTCSAKDMEAVLKLPAFREYRPKLVEGEELLSESVEEIGLGAEAEAMGLRS